MRLQVSVRRHALPIINIIFTTGTGPASKTLGPNAIVTDFLQDINDLVPLESADGEWGLEDYVVEVQATADQEIYYECLHYQTIDSILREDDEVVIRSLGTEDLRSRRLGGRHQISADGRHLIDGVAFGRQWLRKGGRPAIDIPPRKRRRLEINGDSQDLDEESTTLLERIQQFGYGNADLDENEDEDEDEDFVDDGDESGADEVSSEDEEEQPMRIKATAEFDNADIGESEGSKDDEDVESDIMAGTGLELSDELKALLEEAEHLSENGNYYRLPSEVTQSPQKGKRKRREDEDSEAESVFEGFTTPTKPSTYITSPVSSVSSMSMSDDTTVPSDSISNSDDEIRPTDDTSSSGSSSSEDPNSTDTSGEDSESAYSSSDSSSDSSSENETTTKEVNFSSSSPAKKISPMVKPSNSSSSSSSSVSISNERRQAAPGEGSKRTHNKNSREKRKIRLNHLKAEGLLPANAGFADMAALDEHARQERIVDSEMQLDIDASIENKKKALLQQLYFDDKIIQESISETPRLTEDESLLAAVMQDQAANTEDISVEKDAAESQLEVTAEAEPQIEANPAEKQSMAAVNVTMELAEEIPSQEIGARAQDNFIGKATPKSTEKRAKLDLASSRRMLFNSLGLKTPKTPAAEQALREKLTSSAKSTPQWKAEEKAAEKSQGTPTQDDDMDSWKDRIMLSAVECEYEGVKLSTPPFPFKQGWDSNANMRRGANKKSGRKQSKYYDGQSAVEDEEDDYSAQYAPDVSTLPEQRKITPSEQGDRPESRTLSMEEQSLEDGMPRPTDFGSLFNLGTADLAPGAVIAFKELDIQNFQPVVSEYRVARVQAVQTDDTFLPLIELMLSKRDWLSGPKQPDPFAIEDDDALPDDGRRIKAFGDLIEPKLIEASSVQVSATPAQDQGTAPSDLASMPQAQSLVVPEFEEAAQPSIEVDMSNHKVLRISHVEINAPRRNEITAILKEAGFDSAADKDLLRRDAEPETGPQSSPALATRSHRSQQSSRSPVSASIHASTTSVTRPRFDSPGLDGWDSSPLRPVQADSSLVAPSQTSRQPTPKASKTHSSVAYPALSQLDLDNTGLTVTNDSSFQDAQRVSQPLEIDTSNLQPDLDTSKLHPGYPYGDFGDATQQSLALEVPQSQSPPPSAPPIQDTGKKSTFLGHGLDGQVSSDDGSDFDSASSSFPSLHELTSSQNQKIKQASHRSHASPPSAKTKASILPPATRRGKKLRNGKKRSTSPTFPEGEEDDGVELPPIKTSSSQPRMCQIPPGSQIVDLTFSSDAIEEGSGGEYQAPRTRGASSRKAKAPVAGSQSSANQSVEDEGADAGGIGRRSFLTTKKRKSHV